MSSSNNSSRARYTSKSNNDKAHADYPRLYFEFNGELKTPEELSSKEIIELSPNDYLVFRRYNDFYLYAIYEATHPDPDLYLYPHPTPTPTPTPTHSEQEPVERLTQNDPQVSSHSATQEPTARQSLPGTQHDHPVQSTLSALPTHPLADEWGRVSLEGSTRSPRCTNQDPFDQIDSYPGGGVSECRELVQPFIKNQSRRLHNPTSATYPYRTYSFESEDPFFSHSFYVSFDCLSQSLYHLFFPIFSAAVTLSSRVKKWFRGINRIRRPTETSHLCRFLTIGEHRKERSWCKGISTSQKFFRPRHQSRR